MILFNGIIPVMMQGKAKKTEPKSWLSQEQKSEIDKKITALLDEVDKDEHGLKRELSDTGMYRWLDNFIQKYTSYDYSITEIISEFISCTDEETLHKLLKILAEALGREIFVLHILKGENIVQIIGKPFAVQFLLKDQYITFELLEKILTEHTKERKKRMSNKTFDENLVEFLKDLVNLLCKIENEDVSREKQLVYKLLQIIKQTKFTDIICVDQDHEIKQKLDRYRILSYDDEDIRYLKCIYAKLDEVHSVASEISTFVNQEGEDVVQIDLHDICLIIQCAKLYNLMCNTGFIIQKDVSKPDGNISVVSEVASPSKTTGSMNI